MVSEAYRRCEEILTSQRKELDTVAGYLLENETMEQTEFLRVFGETPKGNVDLRKDW